MPEEPYELPAVDHLRLKTLLERLSLETGCLIIDLDQGFLILSAQSLVSEEGSGEVLCSHLEKLVKALEREEEGLHRKVG